MEKLFIPLCWLSSVMIWAKPKQIWQDQQHLWDQDEQILLDLDLNCSWWWWKFLCSVYKLSTVTINVVYVKAFFFTSRRFSTFPYYMLMNTTVVIIDSLCCTVLVFMKHKSIHPCYYIQHMRWCVTKFLYNTVYPTCYSKPGGMLFMLHLNKLTCVWVHFSNWFAVWAAEVSSLWR